LNIQKGEIMCQADSRACPFTFREVGVSFIEMQALPGPEVRHRRIMPKNHWQGSFLGPDLVFKISKLGGYWVYARALAKPTHDPYMTMTPSLYMAEDENGTPLLFLGTLTSSGFVSAAGETFTRSKGQSKAVPISGMFNWTGYVCYETDPDGEGTFYIPTQMCGLDTNGDTLIDQIALPVDGLCTAGALVELYCHNYETPTWVFNIADFVTYLWSTDNYGLKLLQIRFYRITQ
jgi:hypothetical protein